MLPSPLPGQSQAQLAVLSSASGELVLGGDRCLAGEECMHYLAVAVQVCLHCVHVCLNACVATILP